MSLVFLSVPPKKGYSVDLEKPLIKFIKETYPGQDHKDAVKQFDQLRSQVIAKGQDRHVSVLDLMKRYHDQMFAAEHKFPLTENQIRINFKWQDAFSSSKSTVPSGSFERCCVMWNMAALSTCLAAGSSDWGDNNLKLAAKYFQQAAGIWKWLHENVATLAPSDPGADIAYDTCDGLHRVALAQAQETILKKATMDKMKVATLAKVASHAAELYQSALQTCKQPYLVDIWPRGFVAQLTGKYHLMKAWEHYHQSTVAKDNKSFGEQIARLDAAIDCLQEADKASRDISAKDYIGRIQQELVAAKKDNDLIYNDTVPSKVSLAAVPGAAVVKPTPLEGPGTDFTDIFAAIVPMAVAGAMASFEQRKGAAIQAEVGRMREQTSLMNGVLASLNLPAAIEDRGAGLPASLLEKAAKVRDRGGMAAVQRLVNELPGALERNREVLAEANRLLGEEESSDSALKTQFADRWNRTASSALNEPMKTEAARYKSLLDSASSADGVVRQKVETHREAMELLSLEEVELQQKMPGAGGAGVGRTPVVEQLRTAMSRVEGLKAERDRLENEIRNYPFKMEHTFLGDSSGQDEEALSMQKLNEAYGPLREQVSGTISAQEELMEEIQRLHAEFSGGRGGGNAGARDEMLRKLQAGYDAFEELLSNLQEGSKFYNDLVEILIRFQNKVSDFVFARQTEKDDLLKTLQQNIAARPTSSAPPPRPPPPTAQAPPPQQAPPQQQAPPAGNPAYPTQPQAPAGYPYGQPQQIYGQPGQMPPYNPYQPPGFAPQYGAYPPQYPPGAYPPPQSGYATYPPQGYPQYPQYPGYPQPPQ